MKIEKYFDNVPAIYQVLFLFTLTLIFTTHHAPISIDGWHDGMMFKPALDVAEGRVLYKDTSNIHNTLTVLLQAATLAVFGHKLIVIKLMTAVVYSLIIIPLWLIWSRFLPKYLNFLACSIYIALAPYHIYTFEPWSSVYALFTQLAALYAVILYLESKQKTHIFLLITGICTNLTFWFKQPVGIFLTGAVLIFLVFDSFFKKHSFKTTLTVLAFFIAGNLIPSLLILGWLFTNGTVKDWWLQTIYHNYLVGKVSASAGGPYSIKGWLNSLFTLTGFVFRKASESTDSYDRFTWIFFPSTILLMFINELSCLRKKAYDNSASMLFAALFVCLASWGQYYPIDSMTHCYHASTPMIGLTVYFLYSYIKNIYTEVNLVTKTVRVLFIIFFAVIISQSVYFRVTQDIQKSFKTEYFTLTVPDVLKGMKLSDLKTKKLLEEIDSFLKDYSKTHDHTYFLGDDYNLLLRTFVKNNINYHPAYYTYYMYFFDVVYPERRQALYKFLREKKPVVYMPARPDYIADGYCPKKRFINRSYTTIGYDTLFVSCNAFDKNIFEPAQNDFTGAVYFKNTADNITINSVYIRYKDLSEGVSSVYVDQTRLTLTLNSKLLPFSKDDLNTKSSKGDIIGVQYRGILDNPFYVTFCINSNFYVTVAFPL